MFNVIAALVTIAVATLLVMRTEWGARFNTVIVAIKVLAVVLVIGVGIFYVDPANWHPFIPERVVGPTALVISASRASRPRPRSSSSRCSATTR